MKVPARVGFLGGAPTEGGWLSNVMKDGFSKLLPPDKIRELEKAYPVPYDASTSRGLAEAVKGLGARSHRLQSLGHDPLLGWIFGVRDILAHGFTAIGSDGRWVFQSVGGAGLPDGGVGLLTQVIDAFTRVGGHMFSDVATPGGLPPPLFGLLQMIQVGDIGDRGRSVAELSRIMYRGGFDFRHFLAGGVGVALTEAIVRLAWMAGELIDGKSLGEALPIGRKPRLQTSLFLAHSVAAAVNAGKVAITKDPFSVNWAQWLFFFRYLLPQAHWCLIGKETARSQFVSGKIDDDFLNLQSQMAETWRLSFGAEVVAVL